MARKNHKQWGQQLAARRQHAGYSQDQFANVLLGLWLNLDASLQAELAHCGVEPPGDIQGFMLSRYETGLRVPVRRGAHLFLVWALLALGLLRAADEANIWLELGGQGYLTPSENAVLFRN